MIHSKAFWISLLVTYLYIAIINLVGHTFIIRSSIADAMDAINADFRRFRVYFLMITWFVITLGTVYFTVYHIPAAHKVQQALMTGALISIIADGTWVFTNLAFVPTISALPFALAEIAWHTVHGAGGGFLALSVFEWAKRIWG